MKRFITRCLDGLPFDARSRRAIDETLEDWAYEERDALSGGARLFTAVRGALAVGRVASLSILRELVDFSWCRGLARRWGAVAALLLLIGLAPMSPMVPVLGARTLVLALLALPVVMVVMMPAATILVFAWRPVGRAVPTVGAAAVLGILASVLVGWVTPFGSDVFNEFVRSSGAFPNAPPPLPPPTKIEAVLGTAGWTCFTGTVAILAATLAKRSPLESRWWLVAPAIYAVLMQRLALQGAIVHGLTLLTTSAVLMGLSMIYGPVVCGCSHSGPLQRRR